MRVLRGTLDHEWNDPAFDRLVAPGDRLAYLRLLTDRRMTGIGVLTRFSIHPAAMSASVLRAAGLIEVDESLGLVWLPRYVETTQTPPAQPILALVAEWQSELGPLARLGHSPLVDKAVAAAIKHVRAYIRDPFDRFPWSDFPKAGASAEAPPTGTVMTFPVQGGKAREWHLSRSLLEELQELFDAVDVETEAKHALAWVRARDSRRKTARGMRRFLTNWMTNAADRGRSAQNGGQLLTTPPAVTANQPARTGERESAMSEAWSQRTGGAA